MNDIKDFDIAGSITGSLTEVFNMMLSMKLELVDESSQSNFEGDRIVSSVSLAGKVVGAVNIMVSHEFSRIMAAAMMGVEPGGIEGEEDVRDVISEVCNIVSGNLKTKFCDAGLTCELSPPTFTTGSDFMIESLNTDRHERYAFSFEEYSIVVEVGVRVDMQAAIDDAHETKEQPVPVDINDAKGFDLKAPVTDSVSEVFKTMLSMDLEPSEEDVAPDQEGGRIVGSVSFVGLIMGSLRIHMSDNLSRLMTAGMLGMEVDEIESEEEIKDVISEICNIVGGNLKSNLCDAGLTCVLSTPTFTTGTDFSVEFQKMLRYEKFSFHHQQEKIIIEIGLDINKGPKSEQAEKGQEKSAGDEALESIDSQEAIDGLISSGTASQNETQSNVSEAPGHQKGKSDGAGEMEEAYRNLEFVLDIPIEITVELGQTTKKIGEMLELGQGSVVELSNLEGEPVDMLVNKTLIAKGEVVVDKEKYGVRITEIATNMERIRSLN